MKIFHHKLYSFPADRTWILISKKNNCAVYAADDVRALSVNEGCILGLIHAY
jgi:hypothetical protein